ncbi:MAG: fibronectin type III domain-containing protein [Nitrospirae bacterium]|nr:fibronectin type III domain-containing protein [Nitrospirota bacterium]
MTNHIFRILNIKNILLYGSFIFIIFLNTSPLFAGSATLKWIAPTNNSDGSLLKNIAGYKIYYGASSGSYSKRINVGNTTAYTINNLIDGFTYYFVTTVYDKSGNESEYSNEVSKKIGETGSSANMHTLTVRKSGGGAGRVLSSPSGINCGADCTRSYNAGSLITLKAAPDSNSVFSGWLGGGCAGTGQCVLTLNRATTVRANFSVIKLRSISGK